MFTTICLIEGLGKSESLPSLAFNLVKENLVHVIRVKKLTFWWAPKICTIENKRFWGLLQNVICKAHQARHYLNGLTKDGEW